MNSRALTIPFAIFAATTCAAHADACAPPTGFSDTPPPAILRDQNFVTHTETIEVARAPEAVRAAASRPLEEQISKSDELPGIAGTYPLTPGEFGATGSRRLDCLTDGSTLVEQVLFSDQNRFRYIVWNYTSEKAAAVSYGIGEFLYEARGETETRIRWSYSFALDESHFPGRLGALGRFLFRKFFLEGDYAKMMRGVLASMKAAAESG
jgi:hypothetical protein